MRSPTVGGFSRTSVVLLLTLVCSPPLSPSYRTGLRLTKRHITMQPAPSSLPILVDRDFRISINYCYLRGLCPVSTCYKDLLDQFYIQCLSKLHEKNPEIKYTCNIFFEYPAFILLCNFKQIINACQNFYH